MDKYFPYTQWVISLVLAVSLMASLITSSCSPNMREWFPAKFNGTKIVCRKIGSFSSPNYECVNKVEDMK